MTVVSKISATGRPKEFSEWLDTVKATGMQYELVIDAGCINHVYVYETDNGDWSGINYGRIVGSKNLAYLIRTYRPRMVNGKFIANYDVDQERQERGD